MATLQQLRGDVIDYLKETASDTHFTTERLNAYLNRSVETTAIISESSEDSIDLAVEQNIGAYTLPSDNLLIVDAYFGDKNKTNDLKPIKVYSKEVLKNINPFWLDETSSTTGEPLRLTQLDRMTVFIDPRPNADNAAKRLVLYYVFLPAPMVADGNEPNLPLIFHRILPFYALFLAYGVLKNPKMSAKYYNDWLTHYQLYKSLLYRQAEDSFRFNFVHKED